MLIVAGVLLALAGPVGSIEVARTATTATRDAFSVSLGGELFLRLQSAKLEGAADWSRAYEINRAEIALTMRYGEVFRLRIEPDFGGGNVGVRDVFLEFEPSSMFDLRLGRVKSPYGWLDNMGRFELPSLSRGLVTEVLRDRLGFGGRQVAVMPRVRLKEVTGKPWIQGGVFGDLSTDLGADGAAAIGVKPMKGLDVSLSWHHHAGALVGGGHGNAVSLAVAYDRKFLFAAIEGHLAYAALLRKNGQAAVENAGLWAVRGLFSVPFAVHEDVIVGPFVGASILDPQLGAGSDLGFEILGGVDARWLGVIRVGIEADVQIGEASFVVADRTQLTAFVGASL